MRENHTCIQQRQKHLVLLNLRYLNHISYLSILQLAHHSAYLLVSHGSRDPRPQIQVERLCQLLVARLGQSALSSSQGNYSTHRNGDFAQSQAIAPQVEPAQHQSPTTLTTVTPPGSPLIGAAVLECHPLPLHLQIQKFAQQAVALGFHTVRIVPLFLLPGVHVLEDIPTEVAIAQSQLNLPLSLEITPHFGSQPHLKGLLQVPGSSSPQTARILMSHGSRRPGGNAPVEAIAHSLNTSVAYWSVTPSLETQVAHLADQGYREIVVYPYFLFAGGITDAIAQTLQALAQCHPHLSLQLKEPLGATSALAEVMTELLGE